MKYFVLLFVLILLPLISANVALIGQDNVIEGILSNEGYDYDVLTDSQLLNVDWEDYSLIILKNTNKEDLIPAENIIFLDKGYVDEAWPRASVGTTSHFMLTFIQIGTDFTQGFSNIQFNCYTQSENLYQLSSYSNQFIKTIAYKNTNRAVVAYSENPGKVFFGIPETNYWTEDTKKLFKNSIEWLLYEEDIEEPVVELVSPIDNIVLDVNETYLYYTVSDNLAETLNCTLFSDFFGTWQEELSEEVLPGENDFNAWEIENRDYEWQVKCFDGFNYGESEIFNFSIDVDYSVDECEIDSDCDDSNVCTTDSCESGECVYGDISNCCVNNNDCNAGYECEDNACVKEQGRTIYENLDMCENIDERIELEIRYPEENYEIDAGRSFDVRTQIKNLFDEELDFEVFVYIYDIDEKEEVKDEGEDIEILKNRRAYPSFEFNTDELDGSYLIYLKVETEQNGTVYCNEDKVEMKVNREEHEIKIQSFVVDSGVCGDDVEARIIIKNLGKDERDIYVEIKNTKLKISKESDKFNLDMDEEEEIIFYLELPENIDDEKYRFKAIVSYSNQEESKTYKMKIECEKEEIGEIIFNNDNPEEKRNLGLIIGSIIGLLLIVGGTGASIFLKMNGKVRKIRVKNNGKRK